ncbi:calmodulin-lysine N-methyltransferase-like [Halichondria panicea]|uniref:calmodulin-lysine N-methyltransferase-like n=1 Tax=Halichondria panicea TaxID=6063 RepID=UPI00312B8657
MSAPKTSASERWKILKAAILSAQGGGGTQQSSPSTSASVRSFSSYGLFTSSPSQDGWSSYSPREPVPSLKVAPLIRDQTQTTSLQDMIGFNNTGNVCIWPSEEVLAHYCVRHASLFSGQSVVELGCGMSALAGVMLASTQLPSHVLLTDGNSSSVDNVTSIVSRNSEQFGSTMVTSEVLCWDDSFLGSPSLHDGSFDWVLCADCVFFTELHSSLVSTMLKLCRSGTGKVLLFAPGRSGTLQQFLALASQSFKVDIMNCYDDLVHSKHKELIDSHDESYKSDLHYPNMLTLTPLG